MKRFYEISPLTYKISVLKGICIRKYKQKFNQYTYTKMYSDEKLPIIIYEHKSLIRRKLGNVNAVLQDNKAVNLSLATPKVDGVVIKPGEAFSFWELVGSCSKRKGYKEGLIIKGKEVSQGIGGGMCQFTNLIHWLVLHSPLEVIEHHHHNDIDMFPDYGRVVPFGMGTSIMYNYLDYQFINKTEQAFQIIVYTTDDYLCGELRSDKELPVAYHVREEEQYFSKETDGYYRNNKVYRTLIDKCTGAILHKELLVCSHAKVLYDAVYIPESHLITQAKQ